MMKKLALPKPPHPRVLLQNIQRQVGGCLYISRRNVPYLLLDDGTHSVSLCYFRRTRKLRMFQDLPSGQQSRTDFFDWPTAKAFLRQLFHSESAPA